MSSIFGKRDGFVLREIREADVPLRVVWFNEPLNRQQMTLPEDVNVESTMRWLRSIQGDQSRHDFATVDEASGRTVAMLGVRDKDGSGIPELYILVDPEWQGRGVGTMSIGMMLDWMQLHKHYVGCRLYVSPENRAALALYKKFGFEVRGQRPDGERLLMQVDWRQHG